MAVLATKGLRKTLVNNGVAGVDCLLSFASWCDSPRMFMRMDDATISPKTRPSKNCYLQLIDFVL